MKKIQVPEKNRAETATLLTNEDHTSLERHGHLHIYKQVGEGERLNSDLALLIRERLMENGAGAIGINLFQ